MRSRESLLQMALVFAALSVLPGCFTWSLWDPPNARELVREAEVPASAEPIPAARGQGFVVALAAASASPFAACWPELGGAPRGMRCERIGSASLGDMTRDRGGATAQPVLRVYMHSPGLGVLLAGGLVQPCILAPLRELPAHAALDHQIQVVLLRDRPVQQATWLCVLATPGTLLLDLVTSPAQLLVGLYILAKG